MASNQGLERIGVETVVEGLATYQKQMGEYIKKTQEASKATNDFQNQSNKTGAKSGGLLGVIQNLVGGFKDMAKSATANIPGFEAISSAIGGISTTAIIAVGAVALLATGIFNLGQRGAEFIGIQRAFNSTLGQLGVDGTQYLKELRSAAGDTITELDLMRSTNIALAGASGQVGKEFGAALPKLLEIARVQAAATGQSVDFLFSSLVTGLKRSSPLLIDNTGLVLSVGKANEEYAASIGKTVDQLTDQEKQIALIQATLEAGQNAIAAAGGIQETAADKLARSNALIQNSINNLSIAVEPILGGILDIFNYFAGGVEQATSSVGNVTREIVLRIGSLFSGVGQFIQPVIQFILDTIGNFAQMLVGGIAFFIKGAAAISGAIGNGLLAGANRFIFPAVIAIAQFIADFLSGFSPPKKGPLSTIDTGAGNVMKAWTDGFVGAFKPQAIADVAEQVNYQLGSIATLGIDQVNARLKTLDLALRPFQEQLKLVKDQFDSLKAAADAWLSAIDRQLERLQPALLAGDSAAAEMTRQLNIQRLAIQKNVDAQQEAVDMATLQLAYAQSQQQQERTLLEIQKARLGTQQKQVKATKKAITATGEKAPKPKAGKTSTPQTESLVAAPPSAPPGQTPENPLAGLDVFASDVGATFTDFLGAGGELETFQQNASTLGGIFEQIGQSNPVQGIIGAFSGFGDALQENLVTPVTEKIQEAVGWFTDPNIQGGLANFFGRLRNEGVASVLGGDIGEFVSNFLTSGLILPVNDAIQSVIGLIIGQGGDVASLRDVVNNFFAGVGPGTLSGILDAGVAFFIGLPQRIGDALRPIAVVVWDTIARPIIEALNTVIENVNTFIQNNADFGNLVAGALGIQGLDFRNTRIELLDPNPPAWLTGAAKGGIFSGGALNVGERGREVMMASQPFAVFSNQFVKAMDVLSNAILTGNSFSNQVPVMASAGASSVTNNRTINVNANMRGDVSPIDIASRIAMEGALS